MHDSIIQVTNWLDAVCTHLNVNSSFLFVTYASVLPSGTVSRGFTASIFISTFCFIYIFVKVWYLYIPKLQMHSAAHESQIAKV